PGGRVRRTRGAAAGGAGTARHHRGPRRPGGHPDRADRDRARRVHPRGGEDLVAAPAPALRRHLRGIRRPLPLTWLLLTVRRPLPLAERNVGYGFRRLKRT